MKEKVKKFYSDNKKTIKIVALSALTITLAFGAYYLYKNKNEYYEEYL